MLLLNYDRAAMGHILFRLGLYRMTSVNHGSVWCLHFRYVLYIIGEVLS